jgi:hypothetical protein
MIQEVLRIDISHDMSNPAAKIFQEIVVFSPLKIEGRRFSATRGFYWSVKIETVGIFIRFIMF